MSFDSTFTKNGLSDWELISYQSVDSGKSYRVKIEAFPRNRNTKECYYIKRFYFLSTDSSTNEITFYDPVTHYNNGHANLNDVDIRLAVNEQYPNGYLIQIKGGLNSPSDTYDWRVIHSDLTIMDPELW